MKDLWDLKNLTIHHVQPISERALERPDGRIFFSSSLLLPSLELSDTQVYEP